MPDVEDLISETLAAVRGTDVRLAERQLDQIMIASDGPDGTAMDAALLRRLAAGVARLAPRGWQPADLARLAARRLGATPAGLVVDALAVQRRGLPDPVPPWWDAQLADLDARVWWESDDRHLTAWSARHGLDRFAALRTMVDVLALVEGLPPIAVLRPPPGTTGTTRTAAAPARSRGSGMLSRVRALLAKAESTTFPAEAEALTGKAQELMARHSIDQALLAPDADRPDLPDGVRLGTDPPYPGAKALLVQEVAAANRCEAVWSDDLGFTTVLGWPAELEAVELLYTSLLVQATAAMLRGRGERRGSSGGRGGAGRRRTKGYDESFLNAFAVRIGQRLRAATEEANRQAVEAAGPDRLLPVLAARTEAVREHLDTLFPGVTRARLSVPDEEGWSSGTSAADRATLGAGSGPPRAQLRGGRRGPR